MLRNFIELKKVFPQTSDLPDYYQQLLQIETLLNTSPYTVALNDQVCERLNQAEKNLSQVLTLKDVAYYHFINAVFLKLISWVINDGQMDSIADEELANVTEIHPEISDNIKCLHLYFDIFDIQVEKHESQSLNETFADMLPEYVERSNRIFDTLENFKQQNYYTSRLALEETYHYLNSYTEDHPFVEKQQLQTFIQNIESIMNVAGLLKKALLRDILQFGEKNKALHQLLSEAETLLAKQQFQEASEIYKKCMDYTKENTADPFITIHAKAMRAYMLKLLYIMMPFVYENRKFLSTHLFKDANSGCQYSEELLYIEDIEKIAVYFKFIFDHAHIEQSASHTAAEGFNLSYPLYYSEICYSKENCESHIIPPKAHNILLTAQKYYSTLSEQSPCDHVIDYHLLSLARLLLNEDAFLQHFVQFIAKLQFTNKIPKGYKEYSQQAKSIYLSFVYFLTLLQKRHFFSVEKLEEIKKLIPYNDPNSYKTLYYYASECATQGYTAFAVLLTNVGLLFDGIHNKDFIFNEKYIRELQVATLKTKLWDETLYKQLSLCDAYIELLTYSYISIQASPKPLKKLFKTVTPDILQPPQSLLSLVQIAELERVLSSLLNAKKEEDRYLSVSHCAQLKIILELLFVSKFAHRLAGQLTTDIAHFQSAETEFKETFPQWALLINHFFKDILLSLPVPTLAQIDSIKHAAENQETHASALKKKRRKKSTPPKIFSMTSHASKITSLPRIKVEIADKVPDHIEELVNEQLNKQQHAAASSQEVLQKTANKVKKTRRSRRQVTKSLILEPLQPAADLERPQENDSDIETPSSLPELPVKLLTPIDVPPIYVPPSVNALMQLLKKLGAKRCALVGGHVRDQLLDKHLGIDEQDYDIVFDIPLETLKQQAPELFTRPSFLKDFANVTYEGVNIDLKFSADLANKELSDCEAFQRDAKNRDFRCNAFYADENGQVYDPLELGLDCLKKPYLETIIDTKESFAIDPIRMFRTIYATTKRHLEFSNEMITCLAQGAQSNKVYFSDATYLTRINSQLHKLLYSNKHHAKANFNHLEMFGFIHILFPTLPYVFNKNASFKAWFLSELTHFAATRSINYTYAIFALGHLLEKKVDEQTAISDEDYIKNVLFPAMPLLQKNFENWDIGREIVKAKMRWFEHTRSQSNSPAAASFYGFFNREPQGQSESAPPILSARPASMPRLDH